MDDVLRRWCCSPDSAHRSVRLQHPRARDRSSRSFPLVRACAPACREPTKRAGHPHFTLNVGGAAKAEASEGDPGLYRISRGGKSCSWHEPRCPPDHLHLRFAIGLGVQTERARRPLGHVAGEIVDALGSAVVREALGGSGHRVTVRLFWSRGHIRPDFYGKSETALLAGIGAPLMQTLIIAPHKGSTLLVAGGKLPLLFRGQSSSDPSAVSG